MKQDYNFTASTKVYFGAGKLDILQTLPMPGKKALVVISNGKSVKENGALERVLKQLERIGVETVIYSSIQANPTKESVENGAEIAEQAKCDFVIALGGGSVLDAAKVIAMKTVNPGDLWDYAAGGTGRAQKMKHEPLPWIAIPTTSGTGSEVDAGGVITNLATHEKMGIFGSFATYAIIDPQLTLSVPPYFTVLQGFDALFHCLEGQICKSANFFSEMIQEKAIRLISQNLPIAYQDGSNLEARSNMALASMLSGYSMVASTCTAEHSIEHALSAYHEQLPHGAGLIMISKAYFKTIINQHVADERFIKMARWMGKSDASRPEDFIDMLDDLQQQCDVSNLKMSDYGISPEEFPTMAENALTAMCRLITQDIQPLNKEDIIHILQESYK